MWLASLLVVLREIPDRVACPIAPYLRGPANPLYTRCIVPGDGTQVLQSSGSWPRWSRGGPPVGVSRLPLSRQGTQHILTTRGPRRGKLWAMHQRRGPERLNVVARALSWEARANVLVCIIGKLHQELEGLLGACSVS